ncbi:MAG: glycosyltransferase [Hyphomicrobium sp.]|nr:glycosyltransferase [Hyphomicrobium sp.]
MSRFLFVVPPLYGHINPTLPVGLQLTKRGHDVAWVGVDGVGNMLPEGVAAIELGARIDPPDPVMAGRPVPLRGYAAYRFLMNEVIVPMAKVMTPRMGRVIDEFRPNALFVDQLTLAGGFAARQRGLPWATSSVTLEQFVNRFETLPAVARWEHNILSGLENEAGLTNNGDPRLSSQLVVIFSTAYFIDPTRRYPDHYAFVGPSASGRPEASDFPFDWIDSSNPTVLVSLGTVSSAAGGSFLPAAVEALAARELQGIVVAPDGLIKDAPANVLVRDRVPQLALLPFLNAVVCHAGNGSVCESLAHGLPLVVAPIRDDQPLVADLVVRASAGVRIKFGRAGPRQIGEAIDSVLNKRAYRNGAARIQRSFTAAGGPTAAATALETLI